MTELEKSPRPGTSLQEANNKNSLQGITITMEELQRLATAQGGMVLYHGGLPDDCTMDTINLNHEGAQQNKHGRTYGGFYLTDETVQSWPAKYARERNGNLHGFLINPQARIFETGKNIDRLSRAERKKLSENFDLIRGEDLLGRTQYVLLNKTVVQAVAQKSVADTQDTHNHT